MSRQFYSNPLTLFFLFRIWCDSSLLQFKMRAKGKRAIPYAVNLVIIFTIELIRHFSTTEAFYKTTRQPRLRSNGNGLLSSYDGRNFEILSYR